MRGKVVSQEASHFTTSQIGSLAAFIRNKWLMRVNNTAGTSDRRLFTRIVEAAKQNALWFSLYKKHGAVGKVIETHKIYLLTRDMASISSLFAILFPLGVFAESFKWEVTAIYVAALFFSTS